MLRADNTVPSAGLGLPTEGVLRGMPRLKCARGRNAGRTGCFREGSGVGNLRPPTSLARLPLFKPRRAPYNQCTSTSSTTIACGSLRQREVSRPAAIGLPLPWPTPPTNHRQDAPHHLCGLVEDGGVTTLEPPPPPAPPPLFPPLSLSPRICLSLSLSQDQKINWLEAIKWTLAEWVVAIIYTIASLMFIIGSIYFLPTPLKRHPYVGSWLFVWGSALFFFGGCINIVQTYEVDDKILDQLLISTAMTFIVGSILFVVGSIFFLIVWVDDHDEHRSGTFAAWIFVVGSIFFTLGGFTNAIRIWYIKKHHEDKDKLLGWPMAPYPAPMPYFNGGVLPPPSPYMPPYVVPTPVPMM